MVPRHVTSDWITKFDALLVADTGESPGGGEIAKRIAYTLAAAPLPPRSSPIGPHHMTLPTDWFSLARDILTPPDPEAVQSPLDAALHHAWLDDLHRQSEDLAHIAPEREWRPTRTVRP